MKLTRQRLTLLAALVVLVAGLVYAFVPRPIPVDVATVTRGPLRVTVDEDGKTRIKERYVVSTPMAGRLLRVELHPGDTVEAGKTLITAIEPTDPELLDPRARAQAEARVKSTEAAWMQAVPLLERARTAHEFSQTELARAKTLFDNGTLSHQELDNAEQKERMTAEELKSAQFAVQIAEYELELAKAALLRAQPNSRNDVEPWRFEILSPVSGRVLRVFQESATVVTAGARLLELGDPQDLEVEIDVLSTDAVKIKAGYKVIFDYWGGDSSLHGRVRLIEPAAFTKSSALGVEEQRVNVISDFIGPPTKREQLGDAFRVEARIVTWEGTSVLKVPTGALFRQNDDWSVFCVMNGKARLRSIKVGHRNDLDAEILEGISEGEHVILHPSDKIRAGVAVVGR